MNARRRWALALSRPRGVSEAASTVKNGRIGAPAASTLGSGTTRYFRLGPTSLANHGPLIAVAALPVLNSSPTTAPEASSGTTPARIKRCTSSRDRTPASPRNPKLSSGASCAPPKACSSAAWKYMLRVS